MDIPQPRPVIPDYERPFWEGTRKGELLLQRCSACGFVRYPMAPVCPDCLSEETEWVPASGDGTVESWIVYHQAFHPSFADRLPYNVAWIGLDEGPRMTSNVVGVEPGDLFGGMRVRAIFEPLDDEVVVVKFVPAT